MTGPPRIRLLDLRDDPLSVDEAIAAVTDPGAGGTAAFIGTVRERDSDRSVTRLEYSAHPSALALMREVAEEVVAGHPVVGLAAVHRVGVLQIGDLAVVVVVSAVHRGQAFAAARQMIDELKARVPIWKDQFFADGTEEWVGLP